MMSENKPPIKIFRKVAYELLLIGLALISTVIASAYLKPVTTDPALSAYSSGQSGWPLPYSVTYWLEIQPGGYNTTSFNFTSLAIDLLLFYLFIHLAIFVLKRILRYLSNSRVV